jgi:hypothetical protein
MKAKDLVNETKIGELTAGNFVVLVDDHALEQAVRRNILPSDVDRVIKQFPAVENQIAKIDNGQKFWVFDPKLDVGLGMRKISDTLKVMLKTVVSSRPFDGQIPVINLSSHTQESFTDIEMAVMEGGHELEQTQMTRRSALRQAINCDGDCEELDEAPAGLYFKGSRCTKDCSGHLAGYRWADARGITNDNECGNGITHPSFWMGCSIRANEK